MNGSRVVLECLKKEGVDTLFGYPGGTVAPIYDALYYYQNDFNHIRTAHEQGLVHAADGYSRSSSKIGVCFLTSGPGATNSITGIATAYMDSTPLIIITAQVPTRLFGKDTFQEIDITGITLSITKHNYIVKRKEDIAPTIKEAFKIATTGRKGPVLIDIPKDLLLAEVDFDIDKYIPYKLENKVEYKKRTTIKEHIKEELSRAAQLINESKRPVIYAGGGVKSSNSERILTDFAKKIDTPVLNTLMGFGGIDRKETLSMGLVGMHGSRESNLALSNSDLVMGIGVRFSERAIGNSEEFAKDAKIIHIEIDPSEVNKNINEDVSLIGDIGEILELLIKEVNQKDNSEWKCEINSFKEVDKMGKDEFHPQNILPIVNKKLNKDTIVVTDVGQHQMWTAKCWEFEEGKTFISSAGLGTMGFGLGASIGTKLGNLDKNVILVTGDGSFRMNCNELATISRYNIPVFILLLNNRALGMVRQWQKLFSDKRYSQIDMDDKLDYVKLANSYGIDGYRVSSIKELEDILEKIDINKPVILQCDIEQEYDVYPMVPPDDALERLICN